MPMKRRQFLKTSAGFLAVSLFPGEFLIAREKSAARKVAFRKYQESTSVGKVRIVTPDDGFYIHTFYDVCPFSPSQRFLAVSKLPHQNQHARFGETADICVIDLENETIETVYSTKGWGYQLGANLNWGTTDRYLYANDIIDELAVCIRIDLETKEVKAFAGPMYHLAPDESAAVGFPLDLMNITQVGYGVPPYREAPELEGAPADQGLWWTDLRKNEKRLLVSLEDAAANVDDPLFFEKGNFLFMHTKYNRQGTRMFQVARCLFAEDEIRASPAKGGWNPMLFTMGPKGEDMHLTVPWGVWARGGNHPNWHPDGEHIIMNLTSPEPGDPSRRFCKMHHSGKRIEVLSDKHIGTGHPTVEPRSEYLISDYYVHEYKPAGFEDCPIRLIHLPSKEEVAVCTVFINLPISDSTFRLDPHPAWSRDYKKVCFNGVVNGKRQVFVADLDGVVG